MSETTPDPSATNTDLQALNDSGRGKIIMLVAAVVVALGAASWSFLRDTGRGQPEHPGKVMVVTSDGNHEKFLVKMGFEADAQTERFLEDRAEDEFGATPGQTVQSIVGLADELGFGYVVFADPADLDFSAFGTVAEDARYVAVSVGDLADPNKLTSSSNLLEALFEQDRLKELLPPNKPTDVDAIQLRDTLSEGIEQHTNPRLGIPHRRRRPSYGERPPARRFSGF